MQPSSPNTRIDPSAYLPEPGSTILSDLVDSLPGSVALTGVSPSGEVLFESEGTSSDEDAALFAPHLSRPVDRLLPSPGDPSRLVAYLGLPPSNPGAAPIGRAMYQGPVADPAAWSYDWRSREPKASPAQLRLILRDLPIYLAIREERWPKDPSQLLRYEASDAIDSIRAAKSRAKGALR